MNRKQSKVKLTWVDKFNKNYPKLIRFIYEFSLVSFSLIKTLLTTIGLPIILFLLVIVEINRVQSGISMFEELSTFAMFGAIVLVFLNLIFDTF
jgi:hypothetical protein